MPSYEKARDFEDKTSSCNTTTTAVEIREENTKTPIPEGGLHAWMAVVGVSLVQFTTFGYTNAHGVYNDYYVRNYLANTSTSSQISWIGSTQLFLVLSVGLISGRAFDAGHLRGSYFLMIFGALLFEFCLFMISITQPEHFYQLFLVQGLGLGIAIGIMYIPAVGIISHYFQRRRALAVGFATSGSALGGAIHPIMLNKWFHGSLGFNSGVRASAGLNAGLLVLGLLLMKPRYPKNRKRAISTLASFRTFMKDSPYVIMVIGTFLTLTGLYYPIFFVQLNAIKNGIKPGLAFYTIAIMNGASAVGRIVPNLFVFKFGAFNIVFSTVFITSILVFVTLAITNAAGTIIFAILYGFFSGTYVSVLPMMVASTAESDAEIGARLGVCFTFTGFGGLIGTPIAGALLSTSFIWWRPAFFSGVCVMGGATCFLTTRLLRSKKKGTQWL